MKKLINWLRYPIKLLLRKRVAEYREVLSALEFLLEHTAPKARRQGMTYSTAYVSMKYMALKMKYQAFVSKWEIK